MNDDDEDDRVLRTFVRHFNLRADQPEKVPLPDCATVEQVRKEVAALLSASPRCFLSAEEREACQGKQAPSLREIALRCQEALQAHPEITRDIHVSPALMAHVRGQLAGSMRIAGTASELMRRSGAALLQVRSDALRAAMDALGAVQARIALGAPLALSALFAEALEGQEQAAQRSEVPQEQAAQRSGGPPEQAEPALAGQAGPGPGAAGEKQPDSGPRADADAVAAQLLSLLEGAGRARKGATRPRSRRPRSP